MKEMSRLITGMLEKRKKKQIVWMLIFVILFICSIDIWNWSKIDPLFLGLPFWIIYHIVLTVIAGIMFYLFTVHVWRDD